MPKTLRLLEVHTVPVWIDQLGEHVYGMDDYRTCGFTEQPEVIGWANVGVMEFYGARHELLLTVEA